MVQPIFVLFIILSILWLLASVVHAQKAGALKAVFFVVGVTLTGGVGILLIALAENGLFPFTFLFLGAVLLTAIGVIFLVMGLRRRTETHEMLLSVNPRRFNPDRLLFEKFGRRYFHFKSIIIGLIFIFTGVFVVFRQILQ